MFALVRGAELLGDTGVENPAIIIALRPGGGFRRIIAAPRQRADQSVAGLICHLGASLFGRHINAFGGIEPFAGIGPRKTAGRGDSLVVIVAFGNLHVTERFGEVGIIGKQRPVKG